MIQPIEFWKRFVPSWKLPLWQWGVIFVFCCASIALFSTVFYWQTYADLLISKSRNINNLQAFEYVPPEITRRGAWFFLLPAALYYIRTFPIETEQGIGKLIQQLALHLALSLLFSLLCGIVTVLLCYIVVPIFYGNTYQFEPVQKFISYVTFVSGSVASVVVYWLALGLSHTVSYALAFRRQSLRASALETQLAQAQLHALQMQLNPHFLFNALNSVSSLLYEDVRRADTMITRLGDFLRLTLASPLGQHITLRQELDFVQRFLDIEQMRFEERLRVMWEISPEVRSALVPTFILQPLVENALKHGIMPSASGGTLRISAQKIDNSLHLAVKNELHEYLLQASSNGVSNGHIKNGTSIIAVSPATAHTGIGLQNTRERLERLYGSAYSLEFGTLGEHGFLVHISLPFSSEREN